MKEFLCVDLQCLYENSRRDIVHVQAQLKKKKRLRISVKDAERRNWRGKAVTAGMGILRPQQRFSRDVGRVKLPMWSPQRQFPGF